MIQLLGSTCLPFYIENCTLRVNLFELEKLAKQVLLAKKNRISLLSREESFPMPDSNAPLRISDIAWRWPWQSPAWGRFPKIPLSTFKR